VERVALAVLVLLLTVLVVLSCARYRHLKMLLETQVEMFRFIHRDHLDRDNGHDDEDTPNPPVVKRPIGFDCRRSGHPGAGGEQ
jgi:hypothetical protein